MELTLIGMPARLIDRLKTLSEYTLLSFIRMSEWAYPTFRITKGDFIPPVEFHERTNRVFLGEKD